MLFVGTSIIHPSTEGVFLLCNILDLLIYSLDFMYIAIFQYSFLGICLALVMLKVKLPEALNTQNFIFRVLSWLFMVWTLTAILQQKYVIHTFGEMYKVFSQFPINKVLFNKKLDDAGNILVSIEDKRYFQRQAYSFFSIKYIFALLKDKISSQHGSPKIIILFESGRHFVKNVFAESRGYSTIPMQLIRSLGIKRGYNYKYRRKVFEILYSRMFFKGIEKMLNEDKVGQRRHFKTYLLYIYFHTVNTFLGDATFSKFLNAFDMKYRSKNDKDIYDCSNEGIFIACMGLSKRADYINQDNVEYYLQSIDNVDLNADIICDMVEKMMDKPYDGNYLK